MVPNLKDAIVCCFLNKPSPGLAEFDNFCPVPSLCLRNSIEKVEENQLKRIIEQANYLDPRQLGFKPGHETQMALVAFVDDLGQYLNQGNTPLLVFLILWFLNLFQIAFQYVPGISSDANYR